MTASDVLVESLIDWGAEVVFGLPRDGINGFVEALRTHKDKIRYIHVRHEETAAMAACGYAKFTGKLGVCFATTGPGAVHLMNGLYDAKIDQAPVLAITGMTYHDLIGTNYLQDMNQDYFYQDVAVYNQRLMGPAHAKNIVDYACRAALSRRGVAHLALPIDYQVADMSQQKRYMRNVKGHTSEAFTIPKRIPERTQMEKAARLLQGKKKVAILVGAGARGAREEVIQVADRLGAPVVKALLGKDVIPDDSPYTTGGTGVVGTRASSDVFANCDALLIIGSSFPYIEFLPKPGQAVGVQIDDRPERIGLRYPVEIGLVGDAQATLQEFLMYLPRNEDRSFLRQAQKGMDEWWDLMEERGTRTEKPMKPQVVSWNLSQLPAEDAIICGDSGTVTTHVARMKLRGLSCKGESAKSSEASSTPTTATSPIASGHTYKLVNQNSGYLLDDPNGSTSNGALMDQWQSDGGTNQEWVATVNGSFWTFTNIASGKLLDDPNSNTAPNTQLDQWQANGGSNQNWSVAPVGDGSYKIISQASGLVMDVRGGSTANGAAIIEYPDHDGNNQHWTFQLVQ
jgi:pyruvate dehydrogenase (quinone)/pyruvate oxidase